MKSENDLMPEIIRIVRDAIQDGLLRSERIRTFNYKVNNLKGNALEDYIQGLWDSFDPGHGKDNLP